MWLGWCSSSLTWGGKNQPTLSFIPCVILKSHALQHKARQMLANVMHRNRNAAEISELLHGWISRIVLKHCVWVKIVKESHWRWNLRVGSPWTTMFFLSCRIVFPADTCTVTVLMPSLENVHGRLPSRVITGCWGRERQGVSRSKAPDILTLLILTPQHAHVRLTKGASCSVYTVRTYRVPWGKDSLILTMNLLQFLVPYQEKRNPEPIVAFCPVTTSLKTFIVYWFWAAFPLYIILFKLVQKAFQNLINQNIQFLNEADCSKIDFVTW